MTSRRGVGEYVDAAFSVADSDPLCPANGRPVEQRERTGCWEHIANVGHRKTDTGCARSLPRACAIKDRVDRTVGRPVMRSRVEDCVQLVGSLDHLGRLPWLTSEGSARRGEFWIWLVLLAGGRPCGIGELVDELHHPGQLDPWNKEHSNQCNGINAFLTLQPDGAMVDQPEMSGPGVSRCG